MGVMGRMGAGRKVDGVVVVVGVFNTPTQVGRGRGG
jgi:hypothetical protein